MDTIKADLIDGRRHRRTHSPEFKAQAIAACRAPGVSLSAIALRNGINANLLRRWLIAADQTSGTSTLPTVRGAPTPATQDAFVAVPVPQIVDVNLHIEVHRGGDVIKLSWPISAASECAVFLHDWLK